MEQVKTDKRKYPRIDTSKNKQWRIRVFGVPGKPVEGRIINLSLGGVAFVCHWKHVAKAIKRFTTTVEIQLPDGVLINASTTLVRIKPQPQSDECVCVLALTGIDRSNTSRIKNFIPN